MQTALMSADEPLGHPLQFIGPYTGALESLAVMLSFKDGMKRPNTC